MKRKISVIRSVLLAAEVAPNELHIHDTVRESWYHAKLLEEQKALTLIDAGDEVIITGLSGRGHDLLDLLRDADLVADVQQELEAKGMDPDHLEAALMMLQRRLGERLAEAS